MTPKMQKRWIFMAAHGTRRDLEPLNASGLSTPSRTPPPTTHWAHWDLSPLALGRSGAWVSRV